MGIIEGKQKAPRTANREPPSEPFSACSDLLTQAYDVAFVRICAV